MSWLAHVRSSPRRPFGNAAPAFHPSGARAFFVMQEVEIQYFAVLREQAGRSHEQVSTAAVTAADLYDELRRRHGFTLPVSMLRVAVNDEFREWTTPLRAGDRV